MNVLVTTDGSARSEAVLAHAAKWATATNCGLVLMRALDPRIDCADQLALHLGRLRGAARHPRGAPIRP